MREFESDVRRSKAQKKGKIKGWGRTKKCGTDGKKKGEKIIKAESDRQSTKKKGQKLVS